MTTGQVHEIAQGRIWSGIDALEIGLVDGLGGLNEAISMAAELAEVSDYRIYELPYQKDPLQQIMDQLKGDASIKHALKTELGSNYRYYEYIQSVANSKGIQARLPFEYRIY
jgi:protease-4